MDTQNVTAAKSLAEMLMNTRTEPQTVDTFRTFLQETGITVDLSRDAANVLIAIAGEFDELVAKFGLDTDAYPDAVDAVERIKSTVTIAAVILSEIADAAEGAAEGAADTGASTETAASSELADG